MKDVGQRADQKDWTVKVIGRTDTKPAQKITLPNNIGAFNTPKRK